MAKTLFFPPKHKALAGKISIESPSAFRESVKVLRKGGLTIRERRALVLARTRAKMQLRRKNLSTKERRQFKEISRVRI